MINVVFNMETADPDDVLTLCFLAGHPDVNLVGVVVTPGAKDQIILVKHVLGLLGLSIPVGARKPNHPKNCVSPFHYKWLGNINSTAESDDYGYQVIYNCWKQYSDLYILSGAPLGNIHKALVMNPDIFITKLVVQGGFAGDNIVPTEYRLDKFKGRITCPTFNLGGDKEAALYITSDNCCQIGTKFFISKNVCHGVRYDQKMHELMKPHKDNRIGLNLMYAGMSVYLKDKPEGKMFHDPLAACAMINHDVCEFVPAKLYCTKGEWGSNPSDNYDSLISIKANMDVFIETLTK